MFVNHTRFRNNARKRIQTYLFNYSPPTSDRPFCPVHPNTRSSHYTNRISNTTASTQGPNTPLQITLVKSFSCFSDIRLHSRSRPKVFNTQTHHFLATSLIRSTFIGLASHTMDTHILAHPSHTYTKALKSMINFAESYHETGNVHTNKLEAARGIFLRVRCTNAFMASRCPCISPSADPAEANPSGDNK